MARDRLPGDRRGASDYLDRDLDCSLTMVSLVPDVSDPLVGHGGVDNGVRD